jgi:hypothetical protein
LVRTLSRRWGAVNGSSNLQCFGLL